MIIMMRSYNIYGYRIIEKENDPNTIINFVRNYKLNIKTIINAIKEKIGYK